MFKMAAPQSVIEYGINYIWSHSLVLNSLSHQATNAYLMSTIWKKKQVDRHSQSRAVKSASQKWSDQCDMFIQEKCPTFSLSATPGLPANSINTQIRAQCWWLNIFYLYNPWLHMNSPPSVKASLFSLILRHDRILLTTRVYKDRGVQIKIGVQSEKFRVETFKESLWKGTSLKQGLSHIELPEELQDTTEELQSRTWFIAEHRDTVLSAKE